MSQERPSLLIRARHGAVSWGIPDPIPELQALPSTRHRLPDQGRVGVRPILGGLHRGYRLEWEAA